MIKKNSQRKRKRKFRWLCNARGMVTARSSLIWPINQPEQLGKPVGYWVRVKPISTARQLPLF